MKILALVILALIATTCWGIIRQIPSPPPPQVKIDYCADRSVGMFMMCSEVDRYEWT